MMLDKVNPYAPHAITIIGVGLYWLGVPYGGLIVYAGFLFTGIYYLATEIKRPMISNRFFKIILIILPSILIVLAILSFAMGINNFLPIILILVMYSLIKGKSDQNATTNES